MELQCYTYRKGALWEAICTDLDVAVFGTSHEGVKRSLAEAVDLRLETIAGLPSQDRHALLSRRAPWNVRLGLHLLFRVHNLRGKWRKRSNSGDKERHRFVVRREFPKCAQRT